MPQPHPVVPIAIIGTGPAGLMAAHVLSTAGHPVHLYEKRSGPGRKLLIAGSSGLNITYDATLEEFSGYYSGNHALVSTALAAFPPEAWLGFIRSLGMKTFKGTSRRWFVEGETGGQVMKASGLLKAWVDSLLKRGVQFHFEHECRSFEHLPSGGVSLEFVKSGGPTEKAEAGAVLFALGGGSWEPAETPLRWPALFQAKGIRFTPFRPSNAGFRVHWPAPFLEEADRHPLKNITVISKKGSKTGDAMITQYGIEGTPVYFAGMTGTISLDLKPDLSSEQILERLTAGREKLSPIRAAKKNLNLCPASLALLFHLAPKEDLISPVSLSRVMKNFPLTLGEAQPLAEAISSSGGIDSRELNPDLMFTNHPGVFAAGEMLDWDAPTGGFLIQACVSQGWLAARGILKTLDHG